MSRCVRWVGLATAIAAMVSLAVAITTPPRSGPFCRSDCIGYPYTDAAAFVPRDYVWMYPATALALLAVGLAACLHSWVPVIRRPLTLAAVCFTAIGAGALVVDYGIQLTVLQPALLSAETEGLSVWSQYNPHGVFIALENVGYATLSLGMLSQGLALVGAGLLTGRRSGPIRAAGWIFAGGGVATVVLLIGLGAAYGASLDYRFEVFSLLVSWLALICGGIALSLARPSPVDPTA